MPIARIGSLFGTQYQNAAFLVVPPSSSAFSRSTTSLPSQRLNSAVGKAAGAAADHDDVGFGVERRCA